MVDKVYDSLEAEQRQIDALINRGLEFDVPVIGLRKYFTRSKTKTHAITEPYLGVLDLLANEFIKMEIDEDELKENPLSVSNKSVAQHSKRLARIVAISVLNDRCCIHLTNHKWVYNHLLINSYTNYFLARIKPSKLLKIVAIIRQISNVGDFINSIRLMSGTNMIRTTQPKADLIEQSKRAETALGE